MKLYKMISFIPPSQFFPCNENFQDLLTEQLSNV